MHVKACTGNEVALGQQFRAVRQIEALAMPLIDVIAGHSQTARPASVGRIG